MRVLMTVVLGFLFVLCVGFAPAVADSHDAQEEPLGTLIRRLNVVVRNIIVMTKGECASLGPDWQRYEGLDGRFPLGAGDNQDHREEDRTFAVGQTGGAYQHQLKVAEMPSHRHGYHDRYFNNDRHGSQHGDDDDRDRHFRNDVRNTGAVGENQPHNNMPPFRVMNFCHIASPAP